MKRSTWKSFAVYLVIFLLFFSMIEFFGSSSEPTSEQKEVYGQNYTEFMEMLSKLPLRRMTIIRRSAGRPKTVKSSACRSPKTTTI